MDEQGFDRLARATVGRSRRAVVKALAGAAAGGLLAALGGRRAGSPATRSGCHLTGSETNPVVLLKVSVNAVPAHEAHRDAIDPDFSSDPAHCGGCGSACGAGRAASPGRARAAAGSTRRAAPNRPATPG